MGKEWLSVYGEYAGGQEVVIGEVMLGLLDWDSRGWLGLFRGSRNYSSTSTKTRNAT